MGKPYLIWVGAATDPSGYGEATRNYLNGMDALDEYKLKLINRQFWHGDKLILPRKMVARFDELSKVQLPPSCEDGMVTLFNLTPENYFIPGNVKSTCIGMTTFETDSVPAPWLLPMRAMDHIITFSKFNEETFKKAGVDRPIHIVPHGVDTDMFSPDVKPMDWLKKAIGNRFAFGSNFDWNTRKNAKGMLKGYFDAFTDKDDVVLVLKCYFQFPYTESVNTIKKNISDFKKDKYPGRKDFPALLLITTILPPEDIPSFYTSIDSYVLVSRGEGWSLTHSEAMASGLPTIGTGWGGNMEFMNKENSFLIDDFQIRDISLEAVSHQPHYAGQKWACPSLKQIAEKMRYIYDNQEEGKRVGSIARGEMIDKWTWKNACKILDKTIKEIM